MSEQLEWADGDSRLELRPNPPAERRYDWDELDELVASNATVHLEQMSDQYFALIVEAGGRRVCLHIGALHEHSRARVGAMVSWNDATSATGSPK